MTSPASLWILRALFAHSWDVRTALIHAAGRLPWEEVSRATLLHPRSVRDAILDLIETEAYWAHHVLDDAGDWRAYDRSDVSSAERLARHAAAAERRTAERLAAFPSAELARPRRGPDGAAWTAADVLLRAVSANLADAGAIAERLAALGVRPALPAWRPSGAVNGQQGGRVI